MEESRAKSCPTVGQVWSDGTNCFVITHEDDGDYDILWSNGNTERELPDMRDYYLAGEYRTIKDAIASEEFKLPLTRSDLVNNCCVWSCRPCFTICAKIWVRREEQSRTWYTLV